MKKLIKEEVRKDYVEMTETLTWLYTTVVNRDPAMGAALGPGLKKRVEVYQAKADALQGKCPTCGQLGYHEKVT